MTAEVEGGLVQVWAYCLACEVEGWDQERHGVGSSTY